MGVEIKLPKKLPGEQLLIRIIDSIEGVTGALLRPWLYKRDAINKAKVDVEVMRIHQRGMIFLRQDFEQLRRGKKKIGPNYELIDGDGVGTTDVDLLEIEKVKQQFLEALEAQGINPKNFVEVERQINLNQIDMLMVEEAQNEASAAANDNAVDPDWFVQWRNRAQDVSHEQMQRLWAKVRLCESKSTGSFSVHAMELLGRMSRNDADLIARVGNYVLATKYIAKEARQVLAADGIGTDQLIHLEHIGVLSHVSLLGGFTMPVTTQGDFEGLPYALIRNNDRALVLFLKDGAPVTNGLPVATLPAALVTEAGRQLLSLADCTGKDEYLKSVANRLAGSFENAQIGRAISVGDDRFEVADRVPI